jgi:hypothetical protein
MRKSSESTLSLIANYTCRSMIRLVRISVCLTMTRSRPPRLGAGPLCCHGEGTTPHILCSQRYNVHCIHTQHTYTIRLSITSIILFLVNALYIQTRCTIADTTGTAGSVLISEIPLYNNMKSWVGTTIE